MELQREDVRLFFEEEGKGEPTFVFIHGTGGDHTHLKPQFDYFYKKGKALNVDLRGHGKSDKPKESYSLETFADDIHYICQARHVSNPILIGFSMGGNIALDLASRYPDFPSGVVILDSAFLYAKPVVSMLNALLRELQGENFASCIHQIVSNGLLPTDQCKQYVEESLLKTPQYVWASAFEQMIAWDAHTESRLKQCKQPLLYIEAAKQNLDKNRLQELCPQLIWGKVVGSGHSLTLEVPDQVNAMIDQFLHLIHYTGHGMRSGNPC